MWKANGLGPRAASAAALAGCDSIEEITRLGRTYFEKRPNLGPKSLAELAAIANWPPRLGTALDTIATTLAMGMDPAEAREVATDVLTSLRTAGFVLTISPRSNVSRSAPGGSR
jgi:hypothetical protein